MKIPLIYSVLGKNMQKIYGGNLCIIVIVHNMAMHFLMLHLYPKPILYVVHINGPEKLQLLRYKANIKESKSE